MVEKKKADITRCEFKLPKEQHHRLKIQSSIEQRSMTEIVIEAVEQYLNNTKKG
jgi:predicted DNA-binding protein